MYITCLDMEGVLVPEIWIAFSEVSGIVLIWKEYWYRRSGSLFQK